MMSKQSAVEIRKAHRGHQVVTSLTSGSLACLTCGRIVHRQSVPVVAGCTEKYDQIKIEVWT